jgi:hypothetical protein
LTTRREPRQAHAESENNVACDLSTAKKISLNNYISHGASSSIRCCLLFRKEKAIHVAGE